MDTSAPLTRGTARPFQPAWVLHEVALLCAASVFLALTARISVPLPFTPVPITGQTLGVIVLGALYGPRRGALAVAVYLLEGLLGAPVFAAGRAGPAVFLGPTGGYLLGFIPAAAVAGALAGASRAWPTRVLGMALASLTVYAVGVPWLMAVTGAAPLAALQLGVAPFLVGDAIKVLIAAGVVPGGGLLLERLGVRPS
jgi:biotin transport system substrate-specific component